MYVITSETLRITLARRRDNVRVLTPQHGENHDRGEKQVQPVNGAQVEHEETNGVEPDNFPLVLVSRRFRDFRDFRLPVTVLVPVVGLGQLFLQRRHALQRRQNRQNRLSRRTVAQPNSKFSCGFQTVCAADNPAIRPARSTSKYGYSALAPPVLYVSTPARTQ